MVPQRRLSLILQLLLLLRVLLLVCSFLLTPSLFEKTLEDGKVTGLFAKAIYFWSESAHLLSLILPINTRHLQKQMLLRLRQLINIPLMLTQAWIRYHFRSITCFLIVNVFGNLVRIELIYVYVHSYGVGDWEDLFGRGWFVFYYSLLPPPNLLLLQNLRHQTPHSKRLTLSPLQLLLILSDFLCYNSIEGFLLFSAPALVEGLCDVEEAVFVALGF